MEDCNVYNTICCEMDSEIVKKNYKIVKQFINNNVRKHANVILIWENKIDYKLFATKKTNEIFYVNKKENKIYYNVLSNKLLKIMKIEITSKDEIVNNIRKISDIQNVFYLNDFLEKNEINNLQNIKIMPVIINKFLNKEEYSVKLSELVSRNKIKKDYNKLLKIFNFKFKFKIDDFSEIFDTQTGGIIFYDDEVILLKEKNKNHMLFTLFEVDIFSNKLKYAYNIRDGIILRGPLNYYFNMCFLNKYTENEIEKIVENIIIFLKKAEAVFSNQNINVYKNIEDLKCSIAILDIIKNMVTVEMYYFLREKMNNKSLVYIYKDFEHGSIVSKLYNLLKRNYELLYNILFEKKSMDVKENIKKLIKDVVEIEYLIQNISKDNLNMKTIRMWRETDYIIENIMVIKQDIQKIFKENKDIEKYGLNIFGANYGSIDLAVLTEVLARKQRNCQIYSGIVIMCLSYDEIYKKYEIEVESYKNICNKLRKNILIDDNIVSGRSFEYALLTISKELSVPICGLVIRPPQISRINQMYTKKNDARVNLNLFNTYIKGLKGKSLFSKLCDDDLNESLLDRFEIFDEVKENVRKDLFKNRIYEKESFVGKLNIKKINE